MERQKSWRVHIYLLLFLLPIQFGGASIALGGGKYATYSEASTEYEEEIYGVLNLALDYAAMKNAQHSPDQIEELYKHGEHGFRYAMVDGERIKLTMSLADLGGDLPEHNHDDVLQTRRQDPIFHIYKQYYAKTRPDFEDANEYANEIVLDLLFENHAEAALEAMLVLNCWMYISNCLHQVIKTACNDNNTTTTWYVIDRLKALDQAASLWIGPGDDAPRTSENEAGIVEEDSLLQWMGFDNTQSVNGGDSSSIFLYHLAEESSQRLGIKNVNPEIVDLFNSIQQQLSNHNDTTNQCSKEISQSDGILRLKIGRLMDLTTVPLIQNLWYFHLLPSKGSADSKHPHQQQRLDYNQILKYHPEFTFIQVYHEAIMPRVQACDPNLAQELSFDLFEDQLVLDNGDFRMDWIESFQAEALSCFRISCDDIGCNEIGKLYSERELDVFVLEGYNATSAGAVTFGRIDRDVRMVDILLESKAYKAAMEIYTYGYHSHHSLRELALKGDINVDVEGAGESSEHHSQASTFRRYYHRMNIPFPGTEILSALQGYGPHGIATSEEIRATIMGNIQANVLYLSTATSFEIATSRCEHGDIYSARQYWDQGTAIYFGSIEGRMTFNGGDATEAHTSPLGLAKKMRDLFQSRSWSREDDLENKVLGFISRGGELIQHKLCKTLGQLWEQDMLPTFQTTLIQAAMHHNAAWMSGDGDVRETSRAFAEAYSKAILPIIDTVDNVTAAMIQSKLNIESTNQTTDDSLEWIGDHLSPVLPELGIRCEDFGTSINYPSLAICFGDGPLQLALDVFDFSSFEIFQNYSSISLDIREIMRSGTVEKAGNIFRNGLHGPFSLSSLSRFIVGNETMYDPTLNIVAFGSNNIEALQEAEGKTFDFTNGIVESLLLEGHDSLLVAEAAVVCNTWLLIAHKLHESVRKCKHSSNPLLSIDAAVALWIGKTDNNMDNGWMMYSIAEEASTYLDLGESTVNQHILAEFKDMQEIAKECMDTEDSYVEMRTRVNKILRLLMVPLVQMFFVHMWQDYKPTVQIFSRVVIPHVSACNQEAHSRLVDVFYSNFEKSELVDSTFDDLARFLHCSRLSCDELGFLDTSNLGFKYFVWEMCERLKYKSTGTRFVGYIAENDVSEQARLDLDILEVSILTGMGAAEAAEDLYLHGKNALCGEKFDCSSGPISLHSLARSVEDAKMHHTNLFAEYYGHSFATSNTVEAIWRTGRFSQLSWSESSAVVVQNLQIMVTWPAVVWLFESAIASCSVGFQGISIWQWDSAVALYTGTNDAFSDDPKSTDGFLLRSVCNSLCSKFNACDEMGQSRSNKYLIPLLNKVRDSLDKSECRIAKGILDSRIVPLTIVPLTQGVLDATRRIPHQLQQAPGMEFNDGYVYTRSLLPILKAANTTSAETVGQAFESTHNSIESVEGTLHVYKAIGFALPALGMDCNLVYPTLCVLQRNKYTLPSYLKDFANIDYDVAEIKSELLDGNQDAARYIYENGMHSVVGYGGGINEDTVTLKSLATYTTVDTFNDPIHILFLYSEIAGPSAWLDQTFKEVPFGDSYVDAAFNMTSPVISESILVCIVWLAVAHNLHIAIETCKIDAAESTTVAYNLDVAAAFWIGNATIKNGTGNSPGNLWHTQTAEIGTNFNSTDDPNGNILRLLATTKSLVLSNGCEIDSLISAVNKIIAQMKIPLIQGLIHGLRKNDLDRVKLYSRAVVPLISGCNLADVNFLKQSFAKGGNGYDADVIIDHLYHLLPCIDLDCSKIGIHTDHVLPSKEDSRCSAMMDPGNLGTESLKYSRLDLDLREIDIMLQMGAKQAAEDIFFLGKHSNISLSSIARDVMEPAVPRFEFYSVYFKSPTYAHDFVLDGFAYLGNGLSQAEAKASVLRFSQTLLLGHAAINIIFAASNKCETSEEDMVEEPWNSAAALLVGSLDRSREADSLHWYTTYDLAQSHCSEFNTCSDNGVALVNTKIMTALNNGRAAALRHDCNGMRALVEEIQDLILVPVIQGLLSASVKLSMPGYTEKDAAEAHVYSTNLLPLIHEIDAAAAVSLESTFTLGQEQNFLLSTGGSTFSIISDVLEPLGLDCKLVGALEFCPSSEEEEAIGSSFISTLGGFLIALVVIAGIIIVLRLPKERESVPASNALGKMSSQEPSYSGHTGSDGSRRDENSSGGHFRGRSSLSGTAAGMLQEAEESVIKDHLNSEPLGFEDGYAEIPKTLEIKVIEFEDATL